MWVLSFIHSQIVSTNCAPEPHAVKVSKTKRYRKRRSIVKHTSIDLSAVNSALQFRSKGRKKRLVWDTNLIFNSKKPVHRSDSQDKEISNTKDECFENTFDEEIVPVQVKLLTEYKKENVDLKKENKTDLDDDLFLERRLRLGSTQEKCNAWVSDVQNSSNGQIKPHKKITRNNYSTDSESETECSMKLLKRRSELRQRNSCMPEIDVKHITDSDTEDEGETLSSPETARSCPLSAGITHSVSEWMGVTTNSEDCSCNSDLDVLSDTYLEANHDHMVATAILTPPSARVSCTIWEGRDIKKAELSVLEISSSIIAKVESMPNSRDYLYVGLIVSTSYAFFPIICQLCNHYINTKDSFEISFGLTRITKILQNATKYFSDVVGICFGSTKWEHLVVTNLLFQRWVLTTTFFFLLAVAERTFKQRYLYAKLFSHLTSSQRACKSELPHFRLNKVRNIKTWLSVRSYLKKRGPQRSVDVIVSAAFIITLLLLSLLCIELLKDTLSMNSRYNIEALILCLGMGILLLRFMTLGTKINKKYRNLSVLITEQINLHLQIEQKPHKKDELTVANNVLKLAIDLLKELDNPFKISGLSANPILYNVTKVIILSALSGILSEMLGFKLKLHKIKLK